MKNVAKTVKQSLNENVEIPEMPVGNIKYVGCVNSDNGEGLVTPFYNSIKEAFNALVKYVKNLYDSPAYCCTFNKNMLEFNITNAEEYDDTEEYDDAEEYDDDFSETYYIRIVIE